MKLNCKPGDLAYTVAPVRIDKRGRTYRVLRESAVEDHVRLNFGWSYSLPCWLCEDAEGETIFADMSLRPIRDPGEDAVDEILQLVGSPNKVAA
jgi:hypothetical protein